MSNHLRETNRYALGLHQPTLPELNARIQEMLESETNGADVEDVFDRFDDREAEIEKLIEDKVLEDDCGWLLVALPLIVEFGKAIRKPRVLDMLYTMHVMGGLPADRVHRDVDIEAVKLLVHLWFVDAVDDGTYRMTMAAEILAMRLFNPTERHLATP